MKQLWMLDRRGSRPALMVGRRVLIAALMALASLTACGGGDDGDGGGGSDAGSGSGNPTCTLTATATADKTARTITGVGSVSCTGGSATVALEVCVQWNASGSFADIQCQSGTQSGVSQHSVQNVSSCGIGSGRMFRTRANASINGTALAEVLSSTVACE